MIADFVIQEETGGNASLVIFYMSIFFMYIVTNPSRTTLYTGVTNDLLTRIMQHKENKGKSKTFAGRYYCYKMIYYERYNDVNTAIEREKEIKDLSRKKKEALIESLNPRLEFYDPYGLV